MPFKNHLAKIDNMVSRGQLIEHDEAALACLLEKVCREGGYDFRDYRRGTVVRRLERRLRATGAKDYREYMEVLEQSPGEYGKLADDLTIKVSEFFRGQDTFRQFSDMVLPGILRQKKLRGERELRFWSAACACGEEPYSIAMLLADVLGGQRGDFTISIYATDISHQALAAAKIGAYDAPKLETIPPEFIHKYFDRSGQGYRVKEEIKQMVYFSSYDLTSPLPPPFPDLDCIFCCNVLIYWQKQLQERVVAQLYQALADSGYLVLGEVETPPAELGKKLRRIGNEAKIYQKIVLGEMP